MTRLPPAFRTVPRPLTARPDVVAVTRPDAGLVAETRDVPGRVAAAARLLAARLVVLRPAAADRPAVASPDADLSVPRGAAAEAAVPRPDAARVGVDRLAGPVRAAPARAVVDGVPAARPAVPVVVPTEADPVGAAEAADRRPEAARVVLARVELARAEADFALAGPDSPTFPVLDLAAVDLAVLDLAAVDLAAVDSSVAVLPVPVFAVPVFAVPVFAVDVLDAPEPDVAGPDVAEPGVAEPAPVVPALVVPGDVPVEPACDADAPADAGPGREPPSPDDEAPPAGGSEGDREVAEVPAMVLSRVPALLGPAPFLELVLAMKRFLPVKQPAANSEESSDCVDGCTASQLPRRSATAHRNDATTFCRDARGRIAAGWCGRPALRRPRNRSQAARAPRRGSPPGPCPPPAATARTR
ncbi:hypothetical protein FF36_01328 [Frankia torreyi]|uniref:Uncharacterized protein n=1 Tax=Frankia torreyi TaxID=1856 RepID=A0A0D8BJ40_9ACTN|nr:MULTISPECIES: hypothetical protein [Frankia]KJE24253.1 hypothetical protein FF36_01328 [Frankia torreyi]KQM06871.1 hypothetical protein FF86_1006124 [Frankia sp. CpI1-P]